MFLYKILNKHVSRNRFKLPLAISLIVATTFCWYNKADYLNPGHLSNIFAVVALYSGTFLAFYALLFGWVTSSAPSSIDIEGYRRRLGYIKSAMSLVMTNITLSMTLIPFALLSVDVTKILPGMPFQAFFPYLSSAAFFVLTFIASYLFAQTFGVFSQILLAGEDALFEKLEELNQFERKQKAIEMERNNSLNEKAVSSKQ